MATLTQSDLPSLLQRCIWEKKSLGPGHTQGEGTREGLEQWSRLQSSGADSRAVDASWHQGGHLESLTTPGEGGGKCFLPAGHLHGLLSLPKMLPPPLSLSFAGSQCKVTSSERPSWDPKYWSLSVICKHMPSLWHLLQ